jgi:hypothetical protein
MVGVFSGGVHQRRLNPRRVAGKMRFVDEEANEEVRLLAAMSMLSIMERGRYVSLFCADLNSS